MTRALVSKPRVRASRALDDEVIVEHLPGNGSSLLVELQHCVAELRQCLAAAGHAAVCLGDDALLTRADVSKLTGRSSRALEYDASVGEGIPYVRLGERNVRYRAGDVRDYIRRHTYPHRAAELARQTGS